MGNNSCAVTKVWSFDYLEYLRNRVEACIEGGDPDDVEFGNSPNSRQDA